MKNLLERAIDHWAKGFALLLFAAIASSLLMILPVLIFGTDTEAVQAGLSALDRGFPTPLKILAFLLVPIGVGSVLQSFDWRKEYWQS